jgi:hypothetical protein
MVAGTQPPRAGDWLAGGPERGWYAVPRQRASPDYCAVVAGTAFIAAGWSPGPGS